MTQVNINGKQTILRLHLTNSRHTVLYTGVTNNLERRLSEHKSKLGNSFTKRYNVDQLVHYECGDDINIAIAREKQITAGSRQDKIILINSINPEWEDLSKEFWQ
jgi:putative endonuclease